jgi:hypothetical protein
MQPAWERYCSPVMRVVAVMLAALTLPSFAGGASELRSGLRGVVMRGPTKPVCRDDEPCEKPALGVVLQFARAGRIVARVETGEGGKYSIRLRSGTYTVSTPRPRVGTGLTPRLARVPLGRVARVDFHLDTGIQ